MFGIMMLVFASQLADVAQSTADKTLSYATDMEQAVDCAFHGLPLEECSPDIYKYDFKEDINHTMEVTNEYLSEYMKYLEMKSQFEGGI